MKWNESFVNNEQTRKGKMTGTGGNETLNLVTPGAFLILTEEASFLRAVRRKSLISLICLGCRSKRAQRRKKQGAGKEPRGGSERNGKIAVNTLKESNYP